jgi:glucokinase
MLDPAEVLGWKPLRPPGLTVSGAEAPVVAVDLGATYTRLAFSRSGVVDEVLVRRTADLERSPDLGLVPGVVQAIADLVSESMSRPAAVGVAVAAYVDRSGAVLQERPFGLRAGAGLRDEIGRRFRVPVAVDNDANLAALAELMLGAGRGLTDMAVLTLGTNIGLGVVADGRILRGAHGAACEGGTILIPVHRGRGGRSPYARAGRLGRGSTAAPPGYAILEELVGGGALLRSVETVASPVPGNGSANGAGNGGRGIFARAAAGDHPARQAARHAIEGWALLIADLVALFDPGVFVISGGFVEDAPSFIEPLRRRAAELSPLPPDIRVGDLGPQSGLVGAVVAARSVLRCQVAQVAAPHGPGGRSSGRASGRSFREVER